MFSIVLIRDTIKFILYLYIYIQSGRAYTYIACLSNVFGFRYILYVQPRWAEIESRTQYRVDLRQWGRWKSKRRRFALFFKFKFENSIWCSIGWRHLTELSWIRSSAAQVSRQQFILSTDWINCLISSVACIYLLYTNILCYTRLNKDYYCKGNEVNDYCYVQGESKFIRETVTIKCIFVYRSIIYSINDQSKTIVYLFIMLYSF